MLNRFVEVFLVALRLGFTSFGGPTAHIGYFRDEYVGRRKWLPEQEFADLVALCQMLPGPANSQLGIAIGTIRAGRIGGILAWIGFTMPSAIALILFAYGVSTVEDVSDAPWLAGVKIAVVPVVAVAALSMAKTLCPDRTTATIAIAATAAMLLVPDAAWQFAVIAAGAIAGLAVIKTDTSGAETQKSSSSRSFGGVLIGIFFVLLIGLPILSESLDEFELEVFSGFYTSGSLVFGGGHVVLPLLEAEVVESGWVSADSFIAGYGAAQAIPGPLFTFSSYLGTDSGVFTPLWLGGLFALGAIFLPSFLLIWGALPFWTQLRSSQRFRNALAGVNAAVVGLLVSALYTPVWTSSIKAAEDLALAAVLYALLAVWKLPALLVVVIAAGGGYVLEWL